MTFTPALADRHCTLCSRLYGIASGNSRRSALPGQSRAEEALSNRGVTVTVIVTSGTVNSQHTGSLARQPI